MKFPVSSGKVVSIGNLAFLVGKSFLFWNALLLEIRLNTACHRKVRQ